MYFEVLENRQLLSGFEDNLNKTDEGDLGAGAKNVSASDSNHLNVLNSCVQKTCHCDSSEGSFLNIGTVTWMAAFVVFAMPTVALYASDPYKKDGNGVLMALIGVNVPLFVWTAISLFKLSEYLNSLEATDAVA